MLWLLWTLVTVPLRIGTVAVRVAFGATRLVVRTVGPGRVLAFGLGVGVGLAAAPTSGARLRAALARALSDRRPGRPDPAAVLAGAVRGELARAPRLVQLGPELVHVSVVEGRVTLSGRVPDDGVRAAAVRIVGAVRGVRAVIDALEVEDAAVPGGPGGVGPGPGSA